MHGGERERGLRGSKNPACQGEAACRFGLLGEGEKDALLLLLVMPLSHNRGFSGDPLRISLFYALTTGGS